MQNAGARGDAERRRPRGSGVFLFGSIDPSARDGRSHARPQGELPPARRATNGVLFVPRTAEQAHARRNHGHFEPAASTSADHRRLERAQDAGPCTTIAHGDLPSSPAPRSRAPPTHIAPLRFLPRPLRSTSDRPRTPGSHTSEHVASSLRHFRRIESSPSKYSY